MKLASLTLPQLDLSTSPNKTKLLEEEENLVDFPLVELQIPNASFFQHFDSKSLAFLNYNIELYDQVETFL